MNLNSHKGTEIFFLYLYLLMKVSSSRDRLLRGSHVSGIVRDSLVALNSLCVGSA